MKEEQITILLEEVQVLSDLIRVGNVKEAHPIAQSIARALVNVDVKDAISVSQEVTDAGE